MYEASNAMSVSEKKGILRGRKTWYENFPYLPFPDEKFPGLSRTVIPVRFFPVATLIITNNQEGHLLREL